jgi:PAS domain S-box-containing protein
MALSAPPFRCDHARVGGRPAAPRNQVDLVRHLVDAWHQAARAGSLAAVLETVAENARACVGGDMATVTLVPHLGADARALPKPTAAAPAGRSVVIPLVGETGRRIGVLEVRRARGSGPFSVEDKAILGAFALMAAVRTEQLIFHRNVQAVLDWSPAAIFLKDSDLHYVLANRRAAELVGRTAADDILGRRDDEILPAADAGRVMASDRAILEGHGDVDEEQPAHWPLEGRQFHVHAFGVRDEDDVTIGVGGIVSDITAHRTVQTALAASEEQYRLLFDYGLDAILVSDDAGRYVEANPAACLLLDMSRDEILARSAHDIVVGDLSPPLVNEPLQPDGQVLDGPRYLRVHRLDGTTREAECTVVDNVIPGRHLSVLRDVTERRATERRTFLRTAILDCLLQLPADTALEDQAAAVCEVIVATGFLPNAAIFAPEPPRRLAILGSALGRGDAALHLPPTIEGDRVAAILRKAVDGAWVDDWLHADGGPTRTALDGLDLAAVAWAPVRADGRVIALLAVGGSATAVDLTEQLSDVADLASIVAGSALGRALRERATTAVTRTRVRQVIAARAFHPVFQAIVDLESREPLGYEALTRFDDGTPPDVVFGEAEEAGISIELQIATAELAMQAAGPLPANRFININVSPELLLAREPLRTMLRTWGYGVVLEITEHVEVSDYGAVRAAIAEVGDNVRLAVDDAGAGFASLRHILELRPAMVKLDRSLVAGIDSDPARQALVAGMVHFASGLDFELVAEGIEEEAERATLLELGVRRAQGYLFGRPAEAHVLASTS